MVMAKHRKLRDGREQVVLVPAPPAPAPAPAPAPRFRLPLHRFPRRALATLAQFTSLRQLTNVTCTKLQTSLVALSVSECVGENVGLLPLFLYNSPVETGTSGRDTPDLTYEAVRAAQNTASPLCRAVFLVNLFMHSARQRLLDHDRIDVMLSRMQSLRRLRTVVAARHLIAHRAQRSRLWKDAGVNHVPEHTPPSSPLLPQDNSAVQWFRRNPDHPALGTMCVSLNCQRTRFCREARHDAQDEGTRWTVCVPGGHVTLGDAPMVCTVDKSEGGFMLVTRPDQTRFRIPFAMYLGLARVAPTGIFHVPDNEAAHRASTFHALPTDSWGIVVNCLGEDLWGLALSCRAAFNYAAPTSNFAVARHTAAARFLSKEEAALGDDPMMDKLVFNYSIYTTNYMRVVRLQRRIDENRVRGEELLRAFEREAGTFLDISRKERDECLVPRLRDMDERLLKEHAIDAVDAPCAAALPPRAFWQGSKNRRGVRREHTDRNLASPDSAGIQMRCELACLQEEMANCRNTVGRVLRRIEGGLLKNVHKLVEELRECPLFNGDPDHRLALLRGENEVVLTLEETEAALNELVLGAECALPVATVVGSVLKKMRANIAQTLTDFSRALVQKLVRVPLPADSKFGQWDDYLGHLARTRGCGDDGLCLRMVTEMEAVRVTRGLVVQYRSSTPSPRSRTLHGFLKLHCLTARGVWAEDGEEWPPRAQPGKEHVCVVWTDDVSVGPIVILKQVYTHSRKTADTFATLSEGGQSIPRMFRTHGLLTGKCAPCGRLLPPTKEPFIGKTCLGHLCTALDLHPPKPFR